jgi:hypothetical protein
MRTDPCHPSSDSLSLATEARCVNNAKHMPSVQSRIAAKNDAWSHQGTCSTATASEQRIQAPACCCLLPQLLLLTKCASPPCTSATCCRSSKHTTHRSLSSSFCVSLLPPALAALTLVTVPPAATAGPMTAAAGGIAGLPAAADWDTSGGWWVCGSRLPVAQAAAACVLHAVCACAGAAAVLVAGSVACSRGWLVEAVADAAPARPVAVTLAVVTLLAVAMLAVQLRPDSHAASLARDEGVV